MSESSSPSFIWERRVEFCETDAAGICHFSSFFVFMEQAEHALFRHLGWSVFPIHSRSSIQQQIAARSKQADHGAEDLVSHSSGSGDAPSEALITWPRVHCSCDFVSPARFEDVLKVEVFIDRMGEKSITYRHVIRIGERLVAQGKVVTVCSHVDPVTGHLIGCKIPDAIRAKLTEQRVDCSIGTDAPGI